MKIIDGRKPLLLNRLLVSFVAWSIKHATAFMFYYVMSSRDGPGLDGSDRRTSSASPEMMSSLNVFPPPFPLLPPSRRFHAHNSASPNRSTCMCVTRWGIDWWGRWNCALGADRSDGWGSCCGAAAVSGRLPSSVAAAWRFEGPMNCGAPRPINDPPANDLRTQCINTAAWKEGEGQANRSRAHSTCWELAGRVEGSRGAHSAHTRGSLNRTTTYPPTYTHPHHIVHTESVVLPTPSKKSWYVGMRARRSGFSWDRMEDDSAPTRPPKVNNRNTHTHIHTHVQPLYPHYPTTTTVGSGDRGRDDGAALETRPSPGAWGEGHGSVRTLCVVIYAWVCLVGWAWWGVAVPAPLSIRGSVRQW